MGREWQQLADGRKKLTITDDKGRVPPVYLYGSEQEILDKLAESKINGDLLISSLKGKESGLSAGQRMQVVADLQNPAKVDAAITTVVEAVTGPLSELRHDREEEKQDRINRQAMSAANTFSTTTPDFYPSEHNKNTLVNYMKRMGLDPTKVENYRNAFQELWTAKLLQAKPAEGEEAEEGEGETTTESQGTRTERTAPAQTAPPRTPTRFSTGVRRTDVSGTQPKPTNRLKYTREQIERMSTQTYREKMSDPEFVKAVDAYAAEDRRRQRRAS